MIMERSVEAPSGRYRGVGVSPCCKGADVEESWMTKTKIRQGVESGICSDEKRTQVKNGGERKHLYQVLSG